MPTKTPPKEEGNATATIKHYINGVEVIGNQSARILIKIIQK